MRRRALALLLTTLSAAACAPSSRPEPTIVIGGASPAPPPPSAPSPQPVLVVAKAQPTLAEMFRDPRFARHAPRSRQLVATELSQLGRLLDATPATALDRPKILRRLAEDNVELARTSSGPQLKEARAEAIRYYRLIESEHPTWCALPDASDPAKSTGCLDEVLYYLAYELEQSGLLDHARRTYLNLVQRWPQSRFVPYAYLAFGELFLAEAEHEPAKLTFAEQCYQEVAKYAMRENEAYGYAQYQLGRVLARKEELAKAARAFEQARQWCSQNAEVPGAGQLSDAAATALAKSTAER